MSIIKCPECNNDISNKAKKCVHCGFEFSVCPECNSIIHGDTESCTECGYKLKKSSEDAKKNESGVKNLLSLLHKCESEQIVLKEGFKSTIFITLMLAFMVFLALGYYSIQKWANGDSLSIIANYKDTLSSVKTYIILASISVSIHMCFIFSLEFYRCRYINNWCRTSHIDITPLIKNDILNVLPSLDSFSIFQQLRNVTLPCIRAKRHTTSPHTLSKEHRIFITNVLLTIVGVVFFAIFLFSNVETYMEKVFWIGNSSNSALAEELKFEFKDVENWWMMIVVAITLLANVEGVYRKTINELNDNWVAKFLPECHGAYRKIFESLPSNMKRGLY